MAVRAKIDETSAQERPQFAECYRRELGVAMGADRRNVIFFDELNHVFSPHYIYLYLGKNILFDSRASVWYTSDCWKTSFLSHKKRKQK